MSFIELQWKKDNEEIFICAEGIKSIIEIDVKSKQLKNVKLFFREILFNYYYNNWNKEIILLKNQDISIPEVEILMNELIKTCNTELSGIKDETDFS